MADRKKKRQRPRNGLIEIVNGVLSLIVLAMLAMGAVFFYVAHEFYASGPIPAPTTFMVESGAGLGVTAERLQTQGLISNKDIFQAGGMALKKQAMLKPGVFNIPAGASMADILKILTEDKPIFFGVTIPEGFTAWQVVDRLNGDDHLIGEITSMPAEGSILPQTYDYIPGDTRQSVLDKMQKAMTEQLAKVWAARDPNLPISTPQELVTLASIVEKETGVATERPQVASVFINRLRKHMRLQSDPTIIYGITKGQSTLGRGLRKSEIEQKTEYNTYQIDGLPPGPIANPGIDALKAVANPAQTDYLYFVAKGATPDQGHVFSATYAEHQANVAKWRQIEADAQAQAEAEAAKAALEEQAAEKAGDPTADDAPAQ